MSATTGPLASGPPELEALSKVLPDELVQVSSKINRKDYLE